MNLFIRLLDTSDGVAGQVPVTPLTKFTLLADHSYSWWVKPRNVYKHNTNYFTSIAQSSGSAIISMYKNGVTTSKVVRTFGTKDEHNAPSILIRATDIIVVSHPRNSTDFVVKRYDLDLNELADLGNLNTGAGFTEANYSQLFQVGSRIFMFCREAQYSWGMSYSDDDGVTWSAHKLIFYRSDVSQKFYMQGIQDGDTILFAGYSHPNQGSSNYLWSAEFNATTGDITQVGNLVGNVYDVGWVKAAINTYTKLFQPTLGKMRFLDIAFSSDKNTLYAVVVDFATDNTNGKYYMVKWNRADQTAISKTYICDTGIDSYESYFGGVYFVQGLDDVWNNTVYLARENSGIWYVEEWVYNGTILSKVREIDSLAAGAAGLSLNRPEPPLGSVDGGLKLIYQKGDYNESFTFWDNELIGVK